MNKNQANLIIYYRNQMEVNEVPDDVITPLLNQLATAYIRDDSDTIIGIKEEIHILTKD
jgi:hypothetical protein